MTASAPVAHADGGAARCVSALLRVLAQGVDGVVVLRAGDIPYLSNTAGQRLLAHQELSVAGMRGLMSELLPEAERDELAAGGATRYDSPGRSDLPDERFRIDAEFSGRGPTVRVRHLPAREHDDVPADVFPLGSAALRTTSGDDSLLVPPATDLWPRPPTPPVQY